jgi:hypothetical protein
MLIAKKNRHYSPTPLGEIRRARYDKGKPLNLPLP